MVVCSWLRRLLENGGSHKFSEAFFHFLFCESLNFTRWIANSKEPLGSEKEPPTKTTPLFLYRTWAAVLVLLVIADRWWCVVDHARTYSNGSAEGSAARRVTSYGCWTICGITMPFTDGNVLCSDATNVVVVDILFVRILWSWWTLYNIHAAMYQSVV